MTERPQTTRSPQGAPRGHGSPAPAPMAPLGRAPSQAGPRGVLRRDRPVRGHLRLPHLPAAAGNDPSLGAQAAGEPAAAGPRSGGWSSTASSPASSRPRAASGDQPGRRARHRSTARAAPVAPAPSPGDDGRLMSEHDVSFDAMGCHVRLLIGEPGAGTAPGRGGGRAGAGSSCTSSTRALSRFRPESELCALNATPASAVPASELLRARGQGRPRAAERSGGLVDPTLVGEIESGGYRRLAGGDAPARRSATALAAGAAPQAGAARPGGGAGAASRSTTPPGRSPARRAPLRHAAAPARASPPT